MGDCARGQEREVSDMSVRQEETTPIFAELTAEFDLEKLLGEAGEPEKGAEQGE
ncbi:hypothetical protein GCM10023214_27850 [Amycolatopsis dongchuanensis]|uniref:Uncharacterized protein n=2 Tax=Amycolatopsis TaxID=1813 RepID=A0A1I3TY30_9PSEU|nr:hypothetical protein SAMN05421835_108129 [Amycolatopsis sacchari]